MSKERLEEIKETLKKAEQWELDIWSKESGYDYVEIYLDDVVDIIDSIKILDQQNKRYREAIDYVMETESGHYSNMYELLDDIKFVVNKILESRK